MRLLLTPTSNLVNCGSMVFYIIQHLLLVPGQSTRVGFRDFLQTSVPSHPVSTVIQVYFPLDTNGTAVELTKRSYRESDSKIW